MVLVATCSFCSDFWVYEIHKKEQARNCCVDKGEDEGLVVKWLLVGRYAFGNAADSGAAVVAGIVQWEVLRGVEDNQTGILWIVLREDSYK